MDVNKVNIVDRQFTYKIISVEKDNLAIFFLLKQWSGTAIKTPSGNYKQLEATFEGQRKVSKSMEEHTEYHQVMKYLKKTHAKW